MTPDMQRRHDRSKRTAKISGQAVLVQPENPTETPLLVTTITIDCPDCGGPWVFRMAGHHLHGVKRLVDEWIAQFPEYVGRPDGVHEVERSTIQGRPPRRPEDN